MPHEWEEHNDEVAAEAICRMPDCGALTVTYGATDGVGRDHSEPWEFTCPRCGIEFTVPEYGTSSSVGAQEMAIAEGSSRIAGPGKQVFNRARQPLPTKETSQ